MSKSKSAVERIIDEYGVPIDNYTKYQYGFLQLESRVKEEDRQSLQYILLEIGETKLPQGIYGNVVVEVTAWVDESSLKKDS